ncbi:MAG: hypothetical protein CMJ46_11455 [Planctomyces sp.]|nr:hypothetical protein [Planctomyces sp.]
MSPQLFYSNFDFEYQLRAGYRPTPRLKRLNEELAFCWLALAEEEDQVLLEHSPEPEFLAHLEHARLPCPRFITKTSQINAQRLTPWGWSKPAQDFARQQGFTDLLPDVDSVERVNNRHWCFDFEKNSPDNRKVLWRFHTLSGIRELILENFGENEGWIVKLPLGMSGRDQLRGEGNQLTDAQACWINKRADGEEWLIFERRLACIQELGVQFQVHRRPLTQRPPDNVELIEIVPMLADRNGRYAGSWLLDPDKVRADWSTVVEKFDDTRSLAFSEYFGPVGIDVMQYRDSEGSLAMRYYQDVNARYTMGRLALGWRRYLNPGEVGCWLHLSHRCTTREELEDWWGVRTEPLHGNCRLIRTSPLWHAGEIVRHQTGLLIAESESIAREQVQRILLAG